MWWMLRRFVNHLALRTCCRATCTCVAREQHQPCVVGVRSFNVIFRSIQIERVYIVASIVDGESERGERNVVRV